MRLSYLCWDICSMFVLGGNKSLGQDNWSTSQELAVSTSSPCSVSCNTDLIQHLPRLASHPWTPPVTSKKEEVRKNVLLPFTKKGFGIENLKIPLILFRGCLISFRFYCESFPQSVASLLSLVRDGIKNSLWPLTEQSLIKNVWTYKYILYFVSEKSQLGWY